MLHLFLTSLKIGTLPAFWLYSYITKTGTWPKDGEIDILEHIEEWGNNIQSAIHVPSGYGGNPKTGKVTVNAPTDTFHTYAVDWNEKRLIFYCDDKEYFRVTNDGNLQNYPFFTRKPIILNLAVGGGLPGPAKPSDLPQNLVIDYVKVYEPNP